MSTKKKIFFFPTAIYVHALFGRTGTGKRMWGGRVRNSLNAGNVQLIFSLVFGAATALSVVALAIPLV